MGLLCVLFLLSDSWVLIFSVLLRKFSVSNLSWLWSKLNRTAPICHTVEGWGVYALPLIHSGGAIQTVPKIQRHYNRRWRSLGIYTWKVAGAGCCTIKDIVCWFFLKNTAQAKINDPNTRGLGPDLNQDVFHLYVPVKDGSIQQLLPSVN